MLTLFVVSFVWIILFLGLKLLKDFYLTALSGLMMMVIGVYGFTGGFGYIDMLTYSFSLMNLASGLYFVFRSAIELNLKEDKTWQTINRKKKLLKQSLKQ